jgi:methionine-rich copper-binding protein CopC
MKLFVLLLTTLALSGCTWLDNETTAPPTPPTAQQDSPEPAPIIATQPQVEESVEPEITFSTQKKSAHFVSSKPTHGSTLTELPRSVGLTFNFDLATNSTITVTHQATKVAGTTSFGSDKLSMSRTLDIDPAEGLYTVDYNACWPDTTCHDGVFQFAVDLP